MKNKIIIILIVLVSILIFAGGKNYILNDSKTLEIGFENIGELVTQSVYCTEVNVIEASRELWGIEIPFTQSKYIYKD